jgi:hypothetical protein
MIGVQHKSEIKGIGRFFGGLLPIHQVEKMRRLAQIFAHRRQRFVFSRAMKISRDHADLRGDAAGALTIDLHGCFAMDVGIVEAQHRDGGS